MFNTKLRLQNLLLLVAASLIFFMAGCDKNDDGTEQELVTKVIVHLTGTGSSLFNEEFEAEDTNGDGVWDNIASLNIPVNTTFDVHVHVYDGDEEVNAEIVAEKDEHLFVYKVTGSNLTISDLDTDNNGKPFAIDS